ncbi:MAG: protein phosphatase [Bacillales bacterium]|jgi:protein phosphatase|nr:protein phosphatase [Bacillales bacterium]
MKYFSKSDIGLVRTKNEDSLVVLQNHDMTLAVIADGMGGHLGGQKASNLAIEVIQSAWENVEQSFLPAEAENWIHETIAVANETVFNYSRENSEYEGMGTTVVLALITGGNATIGNIGDSRCYLFENNELSQITEDHSFINYLIKSGEITVEDAVHHPRKNVLTRALGTNEKVEIDTKTIQLENSSTLLLCSDGLYGKVNLDFLVEQLKNETTLEEKTNLYIEEAKNNGGEDNISVIILQNQESEEI